MDSEKTHQKNLMNKKEKVQFVINQLENLYPKTPIPLNHKDTYTLLIAVLLSAQCTDERVNKITPLLFQKADNPFEMVKLSVEEIKSVIRPCGISLFFTNSNIALLTPLILNAPDF